MIPTHEVKRRAFAFREVKVAGDGEPAGTFRGYASVFGNVDLDGDVIDAGAFSKSIAASGGRGVLLWQHDHARPVGVLTGMREDAHGLEVDGEFNLETQAGREAHALLKQGALQGFSVGFYVRDYAVEDGRMHFRDIELVEVSVVTFPANPLAVATDIKAADPDSAAGALVGAVVDLAGAQVKAGRRLSAASVAQIEAALEALTALLAADAAGDDAGDEVDDAGESAGDDDAGQDGAKSAGEIVDGLRKALESASSTIYTEGR